MPGTPETGSRPAVVEIGYAWRGLRDSAAFALIAIFVTTFLAFRAKDEGRIEPVAVVLCVVCGVGTVWLGGFVARAVWRTVRRLPLLTLGSERVVLHSARVALPWSDIAEVRIVSRSPDDRTAKIIVFVPVDADRVLAGLRGMPRRFARSGIKRVGGPIFVRPHDLAMPFAEVLAAVRRVTAVPVRPAIDPRSVGGMRR
ncbi:hypothetical protein NE236_02325 [Actinoallomurus purpureus]|uniref:STM3941 family protein n=1 Tax=Actinoallomurus purpureus TaxID=478114 RepID=UPI0020930804|nr:STM3941 family protein [Actinoallomurus purpureus]MCO6003805.1 hypothetical protein [Actinoallomurus purpureus]